MYTATVGLVNDQTYHQFDAELLRECAALLTETMTALTEAEKNLDPNEVRWRDRPTSTLPKYTIHYPANCPEILCLAIRFKVVAWPWTSRERIERMIQHFLKYAKKSEKWVNCENSSDDEDEDAIYEALCDPEFTTHPLIKMKMELEKMEREQMEHEKMEGEGQK
jgi:hypothetical protein